MSKYVYFKIPKEKLNDFNFDHYCVEGEYQPDPCSLVHNDCNLCPLNLKPYMIKNPLYTEEDYVGYMTDKYKDFSLVELRIEKEELERKINEGGREALNDSFQLDYDLECLEKVNEFINLYEEL